MANLPGGLREAGAAEQTAALASRLLAAGLFGLFLELQGGRDRFRFGREADGGLFWAMGLGRPGPWDWDDLD